MGLKRQSNAAFLFKSRIFDAKSIDAAEHRDGMDGMVVVVVGQQE